MVRTLILTTVPCGNLDDALQHQVPEQSILAINTIAKKETWFVMPSGSIKLTTVGDSTDTIKMIEVALKIIFGWYCYFTNVVKPGELQRDPWIIYKHGFLLYVGNQYMF